MTLSPPPETHFLTVMGTVEESGGTILLLGPREPGFWAHFSAQPEYLDGQPDPLDRWSKRAIGALATQWGGTAVFPSDGPPYPAFLNWALRSGRCFVSPVGMLVHDTAGLMISFRGATRLAGTQPQETAENPCDTCTDKPCLAACPIGALGAGDYQVTACRNYVRTDQGQDCMTQGCAVRRACPVSQTYGRLEAQSAFHMRSFA